MHTQTLLVLACTMIAVSAWSMPYQSHRAPLRISRSPSQPSQHRIPVRPVEAEPQPHRPKRDHHDDYHYGHDHDHDQGHKGTSGVTGPVHTFVKTDKNANYKWGVRHHVGNKYAS